MPPRGPQSGDLIDERYRLDMMIGTGGMGAVWSASVEGSDTERVAVKFLHSQMAQDPLIVQRFLLEARAGLEIRHPNVVPVIAQGFLASQSGEDPTPWLAMELLNGKSLGDTLRLRGRVDAVDALAILADVTSGTAAAHARGIVHRDIKPGNVFLQQAEDSVVPKLLDFGISKYVDPGMDGGLTSTGAIVGSAMYMSPEQAAGGYKVDMRSDVWSLGVMLYRMLTGESPLPAKQHQDILVVLGSPRELDLSALRHPRIPARAAEIVRKCLRKKREERYASAIELEPELRAVLAAEIASSHGPNIDAMLRPASSRATFIAAPIDSERESDATAPTGDLVVAKETHEDDIVDASLVPVAANARQSRQAATTRPMLPELVGPPTPRAIQRISAPTFVVSASKAEPRSAWAKIGAMAFGIAVVAVGAIALRYRAAPPAPPMASSPVVPAMSEVAPPSVSTLASPSSVPSGPVVPAPPKSEPEPEPAPVVELASDVAAPKAAGAHPKARPVRPQPKAAAPSATADPWRRPGF